MKSYRWICPHCSTGTNAPSRLAYTDARRYCLPCSDNRSPEIKARFGSFRLVERYAPTLEKKRKVKAEKTTTKRAVRKVREHLNKYVVNGVDCMKLLKQCAVLPVYGGRKGRAYQRVKSGALALKIHRCAKPPRRKYGHYSGDVHLFVWPEVHQASLRETILHELMHCAQRAWACKCKIHHCRHFEAKMKVAWRQAARRLGEIAEAKPPARRFLQNGTLRYQSLFDAAHG